MRSTAGVVSRIQVLHTHIGTRKIVDQRHAALFHEHRAVRLGDRLAGKCYPHALFRTPERDRKSGSYFKLCSHRSSSFNLKRQDRADSIGVLRQKPKAMEARGPYFSREPHVPSPSAGITIGHGYDLRERASDEVLQHMWSVAMDGER